MTDKNPTRAAGAILAPILAPMVVLMPLAAVAHHSRAEFAQDIGVMEGELVSINWANPHPVFELAVTNDDGSQTSWEIQAFGSMYTLARGGISRDNFGLGDSVEAMERITLSDDQSRLDYSAVFTDSENFTEPATIERFWLALGEMLEPYTCTPGA